MVQMRELVSKCLLSRDVFEMFESLTYTDVLMEIEKQAVVLPLTLLAGPYPQGLS